MPDPRCPYATWKPGVAAGYTRGRNKMRSVKCHYTVGTNSDSLIRNQGLAQWLVTRAGQIYQYAEADALCWDSGEWNDDGPGIEIEYYPPQDGDVVFTDAARDATQALCMWLHTEWGVPLDYWDGDRLPEGSWLGFIAHRALQQSQPHSDFWPASDAAIIFGGAVPPAPLEDDMRIFRDKATLVEYLATANTMQVCPPDQVFDLVAAGVPRTDLEHRTVEWLGLVLPASADGP